MVYIHFQDADPSHLIDRTDKQEVKDLLTRLVSMPAYDIDYDEAVLKGAIRKVKNYNIAEGKRCVLRTTLTSRS